MMADTTPMAATIPNTIPTMVPASRPVPPVPPAPGLDVLEGGFEVVAEVVGLDIVPDGVLEDSVLVLDVVFVVVLDALLSVVVEVVEGFGDVFWEAVE
jgi:hypothetical protein